MIKLTNKINNGILGFIIIIGFLLRVIGARWGFPLELHPDEPFITASAISLFRNHSYDPGFYDWPAHLSIYIDALCFSVYSFIVFHKPLILAYRPNALVFYEISRTLSAIYGTLMIVVGYLIGKEFNQRTALFSATLIALFPLFIEHSHYGTPDILVTLLISTVLLFVIRYIKTQHSKNILIAAVFAGLSVAEKYSGLFFLMVIFSVILLNRYRNFTLLVKESLGCLVLFVGFLFAVAPYLFINHVQAIHRFVFNTTVTSHLGADGLGYLGNLFFYLKIYSAQVGVIGCLFFLSGIYFFVKKEKLIIMIPIFFGALFGLIISHIPLHAERWALPMDMTFLLITAYALSRISEIIIHHNKLQIVFFAGLSIFLVNLFVTSLSVTTSFTLKDTRNIALNYFYRNGITNKNTMSEGYTPYRPNRFHTIFPTLKNLSASRRVKYAILSEAMYGRFLAESKKYPSQVMIYQQLFRKPPLAEFNRTTRKNVSFFFAPLPSIFEPCNIYTQGQMVLRNLFHKRSSLRGPRILVYKI